MANLSSEWTTPFGDPTSFIKSEINKVKNNITNVLKKAEKQIIQTILKGVNSEINTLENKIGLNKSQISDWRSKKPTNGNSNDLNNWNTIGNGLKSTLLQFKRDEFTLAVKAKLLNDAIRSGDNSKVSGSGDTSLSSIKVSEQTIKSQLDSLSSLISSVQSTLAALPISLSPNSANFGITLKNPKPVIKIQDKLDENIDSGVLNSTMSKFELTNDNMVNANYGSSLSTILNKNAVRNALKLAKYMIVLKDPFPKYENLGITNLPFDNFLLNNFVTEGAKDFGIPSFPPYAI